MATVAGQGTVLEAIAAKVDTLVLDVVSARQRLQRLLPAFREIVADAFPEPNEAFKLAGPTSLSITTLRVEQGDVAEMLLFQDRLAELPGIHEITLYGWESNAVTMMLARWRLPGDPGQTDDAELDGSAD